MSSTSQFEQKLKDRKREKREQELIGQRAAQEWPTISMFNQALRYLEIFAQLMKLEPFLQWMKANIEIHDQINHEKKTIDVLVAYKGEGKLSDDEPGIKVVEDVQETAEVGAEPFCAPEQNIVNCPHCKTTFDANVEVPRISLVTEIPKDIQ